MTRLSNTLIASQSRRGQDFEEDLQGIHDFYEIKNMAVIHKMPVKTVLNRREDGEVYANVIGKGLSDFLGVIRGGLAVAMEAKETNQNHFAIRIYQKSHNTIHDHQLEFMDKYQRMKALSVWLVHFAKFSRVFAIKHEQMREWVPPGIAVNKRISYEEMKAIPNTSCVEIERSWRGYDYLQAIENWLR